MINGNSVYNFPGSCNLTSAFICYRNACNIGISPSSKIVGSYFNGAHEDCYINWAVGTSYEPCVQSVRSPMNINELEDWSNESIGAGSEHIRWAVNSDKWVLQEIGWVGHAAQLSQGSNQIAANWIDQVAINISKNPPTAANFSYRRNSSTGDMWIDDPVNNPNCNRYEDLAGAWQSVPGASTCSGGTIVSSSDTVRLTQKGESALYIGASSIRAQIGKEGSWSCVVVSAEGKVLASRRGVHAGVAEVALPTLSKGVYFVTLTTEGKTVAHRRIIK